MTGDLFVCVAGCIGGMLDWITKPSIAECKMKDVEERTLNIIGRINSILTSRPYVLITESLSGWV